MLCKALTSFGKLVKGSTLEFVEETMLHWAYHKDTHEAKTQALTSIPCSDNALRIIPSSEPRAIISLGISANYTSWQAQSYPT